MTTSKLLARKRPRLLPVIDTVVKAVLAHPARTSFWLTLRDELQADGGALVKTLCVARTEAGLDQSIAVIRCFDVIVWMVGKRDNIAIPARGRF